MTERKLPIVTQARAIATRARIVEGAASVFNRDGYALSSQITIADVSGVTKGALQFHFVTKESLAHAVIEEQHRRSSEAASQILAEARGGLKTMLALCNMLGHQLVSDQVVSAGIRLTMEAPSFEIPVTGPYEDWLVTFERLIELGIAEGDLDPNLDPAVVAHFIIPSFTGVQLVSDALENRVDLIRRIREMWEIILPAIVHFSRLAELKTLPAETIR